MDIFKYHNPTLPDKMEQGEIINGIRSKMWVERYDQPSEFELVAPVSSGLRTNLPIGSFISHTKTRVVMTVENHEINETRGQESMIKVTGRSFETASVMEQRVMGTNRTFPYSLSTGVPGFKPGGNPPLQAENVVEHGIASPSSNNDEMAEVGVSIRNLTGGVNTAPLPILKLDMIDKIAWEFIRQYNWGLKNERPYTYHTSSTKLWIYVHPGYDKTDVVVFNYEAGEVESADYLWSNKKDKNSAIVWSKWFGIRVDTPGLEGVDKRQVFIDGTYLDNMYNTLPTLAVETEIKDAMTDLANAAIARGNSIVIAKIEISRRGTRFAYRKDYDIGDIVTVYGRYGTSAAARIVEYVEIEDENGKTEYPSLSILET